MIETTTHIELDEPKITLHRHESAESIFNQFWNFDGDLTFEELLASEAGGVDDSGAEISGYTLGSVFDCMREQSFWAFCKTRTNEIHIWVRNRISDTDLLILLGHEIGHLLEESPLSENSYLADEERADRYGKACVLAGRFAAEFKRSQAAGSR